MNTRWRPSLALVLGGALAGTLTLSFVGLIAFRYLGPEIGFRNAAVILGLLIALATALLGLVLVRLLLRPIIALERYAARVRSGQNDVRPPKHFGTTELHKTALSVIDMAETLQNREATIRSFSDHVTHEIKTPVSAIRAAVELLEDGGALGDADRRLLGEIDGARAQIQVQLEALRDAARARETRYVGSSRLSGVAEKLGAEFPDLTLNWNGEAPVLPLAEQGAMILLGHLLRNAQEHGARHVEILAQQTPRQIVLTVSDDGAGISDGNAARVFDPFFTTRRDRGGTGMGLAIARNIVIAHQGEIRFLPKADGAVFQVTFSNRAAFDQKPAVTVTTNEPKR